MHGVVLRVGAAQRARDDLAARNADVRLQRPPGLGGQSRHAVVNVECGTRGAQRVRLVRARRAEQRHHRVADVLVDRAAIGEHDPVDQRRIASDQRAQVFGIERARQHRVPAQIGEQNRDLPALVRGHFVVVGRLRR
ncbi:hypothetical protein QFZ97_008046 [Paraburkholderia youngii]